VNLYTKKHLDTCVSMISQNILYFGTEGVKLVSYCMSTYNDIIHNTFNLNAIKVHLIALLVFLIELLEYHDRFTKIG
jgi:hypothetical protein